MPAKGRRVTGSEVGRVLFRRMMTLAITGYRDGGRVKGLQGPGREKIVVCEET